MTEQIKIGDLPSGTIFKVDDTYVIKSEYRTNNGICECYIVGTGEMFWGGTKNPNDLLVEPIDFDLLIEVDKRMKKTRPTFYHGRKA